MNKSHLSAYLGVFHAKEHCEAPFELSQCGILAETDHLGSFNVEYSHKNADLRGHSGDLCSWLSNLGPRCVSAVTLHIQVLLSWHMRVLRGL